MSLYADRRFPTVLIRVNGEPAPDFMEARVSFKFTDRIGKKQAATLELSDPDRSFRDEKLQPDDHYQIAWGYPGNMSRARNFRLKEWTTNHDEAAPKVVLTLKDTGLPPKKFQGNDTTTSEPGKTQRPKNWGKIQTSDIAKRIARRHGLTPIVQASNDIDRYAYVQPGNVTDFAYLRRLAEIIDFEFFTDSAVLYYREKHYEDRPRRVFYYYPEGGRDTLLLKFTPKAKVTSVSTRPRTVDVQQQAPEWIIAAEQDLAQAASELFNADLDLAQEAVRQTTSTDMPAGWASAEATRDLLQNNPNSQALNEQNDTRMAQLGEQLRALQEARFNAAVSGETSGKAALKQAARPAGSADQGDKQCPPKAQMPGTTPTGNKPQEKPKTAKFDLKAQDYEVINSSESSAKTTAGTAAQAAKVACAVHIKKKDKAVTATATFIGDPSLVAKTTYEFRGVGVMFSGKWYAKEASHTIGETYTVSMTLKRGSLKKAKKGTQNEADANSTDDSLSKRRDAFVNIGESSYEVWSKDEQSRYNEKVGQTSDGYYTNEGVWVPAPYGAQVPAR